MSARKIEQLAGQLYEACALTLAESEQKGARDDLEFIRLAFEYADRLMQARNDSKQPKRAKGVTVRELPDPVPTRELYDGFLGDLCPGCAAAIGEEHNGGCFLLDWRQSSGIPARQGHGMAAEGLPNHGSLQS